MEPYQSHKAPSQLSGALPTAMATPDHRTFPTEEHDAARLRGVLRVLREWGLARSAPAPARARACALHLLCPDARLLHGAGDDGAGRTGCVVVLLAAVRVRVLCERALQVPSVRKPACARLCPACASAVSGCTSHM